MIEMLRSRLYENALRVEDFLVQDGFLETYLQAHLNLSNEEMVQRQNLALLATTIKNTNDFKSCRRFIPYIPIFILHEWACNLTIYWIKKEINEGVEVPVEHWQIVGNLRKVLRGRNPIPILHFDFADYQRNIVNEYICSILIASQKPHQFNLVFFEVSINNESVFGLRELTRILEKAVIGRLPMRKDLL